MILTCPSCGTQYVVKDGAIPQQGRQVRCAHCSHSWRQEPDEASQQREQIDSNEGGPAVSDPVAEEAVAEAGYVEEAATEPVEQAPAAEPDTGYRESDFTFTPDDEPLVGTSDPSPIPPEAEVPAMAEAAPSGRLEWAGDDEFSPFAEREPVERTGRKRFGLIVVALALIAAIAIAFWLLAPSEWRSRLGIASAGETELKLLLQHTDRQQLASGNELLTISGRVINPTSKAQAVPPIRAELKSSTGKLVYSWIIPPPARNLPPGGSARFNSAELNVPPGAEDLTISIGDPKA
jgi:predicted Zn finger-like uncharacterized protein